MARIRTVKPEFWHDEKLGNLKRDERLLFIGLWNLSDDEGVCRANPAYIKSSLFPYDEDLRVTTITTWLNSLTKARMLIPFIFNDESYFMVRTFQTHQVINRPSQSKWPDCFLSNLLENHSRNTHGVVTEQSYQEMEQGTGNKEQGKEKPPAIVSPFNSVEFLEQWKQWKNYKKVELKFNYKSPQSEQAALEDLAKKAKGFEGVAIQIIHQSMANGWKGFFPLKQNENGTPKTSKQPTGAEVSTGSLFSRIDSMPD